LVRLHREERKRRESNARKSMKGEREESERKKREGEIKNFTSFA
jgi:hypothetical protein